MMGKDGKKVNTEASRIHSKLYNLERITALQEISYNLLLSYWMALTFNHAHNLN